MKYTHFNHFYQVWNFAWSRVFRRFQRRSHSAPSLIRTFVTTSTHLCFHTATEVDFNRHLIPQQLTHTENMACKLTVSSPNASVMLISLVFFI